MSKKWIPFWSDVPFRAFSCPFVETYEELKDHQLHFLVTILQVTCGLRTRTPRAAISHRGWGIFWQFGYWLITNKSSQIFSLSGSEPRLQEAILPLGALPLPCKQAWADFMGSERPYKGQPSNPRQALLDQPPASWSPNRWENSSKISRAANPTHSQRQMLEPTQLRPKVLPNRSTDSWAVPNT